MNTYSALTEEQLADLLNDQDVNAFKEVYERYWYVMFQFARKMVQDNDLAKDIVQDTFLNLYNNMGVTGYFKKTLQAWLYTAVKNRVIDLSIREKRQQNYLSSLRDYVNAGEYITDEKIRENEVLRQINDEIARMPEMVRTIFEMSRKQYLSRKQIAEMTNLPEEKVKKQLAKALKILKGRLGTYFFFQLMTTILWLNKHL